MGITDKKKTGKNGKVKKGKRKKGTAPVPVSSILAPEITTQARRELEEAYVAVAEYSEEVFEHMRSTEENVMPNAYYMDDQADITWPMRPVVMEWLVVIHDYFMLLPETLFLAVNYFDRFLSCSVVSLGKLQLVGATALFIAAKY
jgi:hypothetical protein